MVIKEEKPITLGQVYDSVGDGEKAEDMKQFLKTFIKLDGKKSKELLDELIALDLMKLKDSHLVKIVDFMPENSSEVNKIITDVSLDEAEISKILDVVKKY